MCEMSRDRRIMAVIAGLLAAIAASIHRISGALRIPETILLIAVVIGEVSLVIRMYIVSRR